VAYGASPKKGKNGKEAFKARQDKQIRAIKEFAKRNHLDLDTATWKWVNDGYARRWAEDESLAARNI